MKEQPIPDHGISQMSHACVHRFQHSQIALDSYVSSPPEQVHGELCQLHRMAIVLTRDFFVTRSSWAKRVHALACGLYGSGSTLFQIFDLHQCLYASWSLAKICSILALCVVLSQRCAHTLLYHWLLLDICCIIRPVFLPTLLEHTSLFHFINRPFFQVFLKDYLIKCI